MTRDEIIGRMEWRSDAGVRDIVDRIERIVRAAEKEEREECAKVCDGYGMKGSAAVNCAEAIRSRGQA